MIFAIDPGLRWCGFAVFNGNGHLVEARLIKSQETSARGPPAWKAMADGVRARVEAVTQAERDRFLCAIRAPVKTLVIEVPRIYPHSRDQKGDLNDLLELAGVVGAISQLFPVMSHVYPADWKGQLPKKVMNERVLRTFTAAEGDSLIHHDHNTLDAVGIGLHHLGRLGQRKVFR